MKARAYYCPKKQSIFVDARTAGSMAIARGKIGRTEEPEAAAIRELKEEASFRYR